jgi:hypothetical protein
MTVSCGKFTNPLPGNTRLRENHDGRQRHHQKQ